MKLKEFTTRHGVRIGLSLAVLVILLLNACNVINLEFIQRIENFAYDVRLNVTMPGTVDDRIVIVDIDEQSLLQEGRWPWGRNKLAALVDQLFDHYKIKVMGFDVVFAEKDESSGLKSLVEIEQNYLKSDSAFHGAVEKLRGKLDYDQTFANSLKGRNVVLGYYFHHNNKAGDVGLLPTPSFVSGSFKGKTISFQLSVGYGANLPILQQNATTAGHFNPEPDVDGISRKVSMLIENNGNLYESLSIAVARIALGVPKLEAGFAQGMGVDNQYAGLEWLRLGNRRIPVDADVAALIPYRGQQGSFPYVSASDVLNGKVAKDVLENRIVLLGTTAPGLMDLRATPVQNIYAGVEVHANMIAGILDQNIKERPEYTLGAEVLMLLLVGLLLAFLLPVLNPVWSTALTLAMFTVVIGFNLLVWQAGNLVLPLSSSLLLIGGIYVLNVSYGFFVESRGKRQLAGMFGQYIPPELVEEMVEKGEENFSLEGQNREMTVLFSDVRGFTMISEGMDPKQLSQMMNLFLTVMTQVIHSHRGTIDKYMGDAVMAFWGAPLEDPDHAKNAMQAALDLVESLDAMQEKFKERGWPEIKIGVGLNSGQMTVGNMGSVFRMAYTVMGDSVNLGSRLEGLTRKYGADIIVSEFTKEQVPDFIFRELDCVRVKGKGKPVFIYEPVCEAGMEDKDTRDELKLYREALKLYRAKNWDLAELHFLNLQKMSPMRYLYQMYIKRIVYFRENPPEEGWDGVFTHETK